MCTTTTWQIENLDNIISKEKITEIDDDIVNNKADDYNEFNNEIIKSEHQQRVQQFRTTFFVRYSPPLDNKCRVNNKKFNSKSTSEEVKYNKRIDPYIGRGQAQQLHRPITSEEVKYNKCSERAHR